MTNDSFELYGDLHLQNELICFDRRLITFVDMGISLYNEEKDEKFSFVKMVTSDSSKEIRELYLLAISASQFTKWQIGMSLHMHPTHIDSILNQVKENTLKQVDSMLVASR